MSEVYCCSAGMFSPMKKLVKKSHTCFGFMAVVERAASGVCKSCVCCWRPVMESQWHLPCLTGWHNRSWPAYPVCKRPSYTVNTPSSCTATTYSLTTYFDRECNKYVCVMWGNTESMIMETYIIPRFIYFPGGCWRWTPLLLWHQPVRKTTSSSTIC